MEVLQREGGTLGLGSWAKEVELFAADDGSLLMNFFTERDAKTSESALAACWPRLRELISGLAGVSAFSAGNNRGRARLLSRRGDESLLYSSGDHRYRVSFGSFFQVNRFLIDSLTELVVGGESGETAWDLYAGVGLFARPMASQFAGIVAVESAASAVLDLRENLRGSNHRIVASETAAFLQRAVEQHQAAPDLVVVDPPRAGLGRDVTDRLGKIRPRKITYVSCDPATLSRDLAALLESGYRLRKLHLVDLFPQTFHLESVTHLSLD